jgi:amidase
MTVKDSFDVAGMPAASGLGRLLDRPVGDSAAAGRVRTEGAVIWAKTNTPALTDDAQSFNKLYGTTNNPWDPTRTAGGSSGGAAAAVAVGATALEIGSDLIGGLRGPASFCGVYAHRPTYGLVSQRGHVPPEPGTAAELDLNVVGPIARSARDLRLLLSVLTEAPLPARHAPAALSGLKVGLWVEQPGFSLDPEVRGVAEGFAREMAREGALIQPLIRPVDGDVLLDAFALLLFSQNPGGALAGLLRPPARLARSLGAGPLSWAGRTLGATAWHREWLAANETRARVQRSMRALFTRFDVLLAPCAPTAAFVHDHRALSRRRLQASDGRRYRYGALMDWAALGSLCGLPVTTVPAGRTAAGLPVGVQIIGPRGADTKTLAVAQALEGAVLGFTPPPLS